MILVCLPDLHIRATAPKSRTDNYKEAIKRKLSFIFKHMNNHDDVVYLQPGDLTDDPDLSNATIIDIIQLFRTEDIHTCFGNHDLKYRRKGNTTLDVLIESKLVHYEPYFELQKGIHLYSCNYNEEIPKITTKGFNILLIHKMIVDEIIWDQQTGHEFSKNFLKTNKFDLIVSGDNHKTFIEHNKDRVLVNCGSLMRSTTKQLNHKPCFVIYDTDTKKHTVVNIPINDPIDVFNLEEIDNGNEINESIESFVNGLTECEEVGLNFLDNLHHELVINNIDKDVKCVIEEILKEGNYE